MGELRIYVGIFMMEMMIKMKEERKYVYCTKCKHEENSETKCPYKQLYHICSVNNNDTHDHRYNVHKKNIQYTCED